MTCDHEALSAHADRELDRDDRVRMERHLAGCPACRARLASLEALAGDLALLEAPGPSDDAVAQAARSARVWALNRSARAATASPSAAADARARSKAGADRPGVVAGVVAWVVRLATARVSVPLPALAAGLAIVLLVLSRRGEPIAVDQPVLAAGSGQPAPATLAVCEEWADRGEVWILPDAAREPAPPARTAESTRVLYEESLEI